MFAFTDYMHACVYMYICVYLRRGYAYVMEEVNSCIHVDQATKRCATSSQQILGCASEKSCNLDNHP
jgi:hypothetical protein